MSFDVPIVFIVFNRPDVTRQSFDRIRDQRPTQLFLIADGPRATHPDDVAKCEEVRRVIENIDWTCDVQRNYAESNLGCKERVSSGLNWVFDNVDKAIVLEDDCLAHPDFFRFCDELLSRYEDDDRVAAITGDNFQDAHWRGDASYYFSRYLHVWGWATWRRSWQNYDGELPFWPAWRSSAAWLELLPDSKERRYWASIFDRVGEMDTWDYPWQASTWHHGGLTATPNVRLVSNIGFGPDATHTKSRGCEADLPTADLGAISHPGAVNVDVVADRFVFARHFGGGDVSLLRNPVRWTLRRAKSALRRARRGLVGSYIRRRV